MSLYSDVLKEVSRNGLFDGVRVAVVGVSGGPDSVCLFDLLARMAERGDIAAQVHAAHLNHGLRGAESDEDERFVRELARTRGVPLTVEKRDVRAARERCGGSLEEAARRERYDFLAAVAMKTVTGTSGASEAPARRRPGEVGSGDVPVPVFAQATAVAVGHTADDQAETVLHRLIRGAGLRGLRGMSVSRPISPGSNVRVVRPLLRVRRAEVLDYLRAEGIAFREDSSNRDPAFLRNRIRAELLPLIESAYNPAFAESLLRLSRAADDAWSLLTEQADEAAAGCVHGAEIDLDAFRQTHDALKPLLIDRALAAAMARVSGCAGAGTSHRHCATSSDAGVAALGERGAPDAPQLDATHYEAVIDLALRGEPGARVELPGGLDAVRSRGAVTFCVTVRGTQHSTSDLQHTTSNAAPGVGRPQRETGNPKRRASPRSKVQRPKSRKQGADTANSELGRGTGVPPVSEHETNHGRDGRATISPDNSELGTRNSELDAVPLRVPGEATARAWTVRAELLDRDGFDFDAFLAAKTRYDEAMDFDAVRGTLVLRARRPGDRFRPLGAAGAKKVGDFLTDAKAEGNDRNVMIVADDHGPLWLVGHRIDDRVKMTAATRKVLKLAATRT